MYVFISLTETGSYLLRYFSDFSLHLPPEQLVSYARNSNTSSVKLRLWFRIISFYGKSGFSKSWSTEIGTNRANVLKFSSFVH